MTRLELSGVDAQYGGTPVLREASLLAEAGQVVALVGPNGAGKSTTTAPTTAPTGTCTGRRRQSRHPTQVSTALRSPVRANGRGERLVCSAVFRWRFLAVECSPSWPHVQW